MAAREVDDGTRGYAGRPGRCSSAGLSQRLVWELTSFPQGEGHLGKARPPVCEPGRGRWRCLCSGDPIIILPPSGCWMVVSPSPGGSRPSVEVQGPGRLFQVSDPGPRSHSQCPLHLSARRPHLWCEALAALSSAALSSPPRLWPPASAPSSRVARRKPDPSFLCQALQVYEHDLLFHESSLFSQLTGLALRGVRL